VSAGSLIVTEIPTAGGGVAPVALGRTLMHEHVFVLTPDVQQNYPGEWDEDAQVAGAIEKLTALKAAGIDTIVDPTVVGLGRYIPRIARIAEQVEVNIVVATGVYTYDDVPNFFRLRGPGMRPGLPEPMVELFVRDLTVGIADTGVRAAFLKCAIDVPGMTAGVERVLRAVAKAHLATNAPVMVHTAPRRQNGLAVDELLIAAGVDPHAVLLAHCGDSSDADHLSALAEKGYLLGMDRFGVDIIAPFEERVGIVVELAARGYAERMVLAHDAACYLDWFDPALPPYQPNWHYLHISNDVLPALRERGVTEAQIDTMLIDNPRRWFAR
jgi:phosphotriesterase-related protein